MAVWARPGSRLLPVILTSSSYFPCSMLPDHENTLLLHPSWQLWALSLCQGALDWLLCHLSGCQRAGQPVCFSHRDIRVADRAGEPWKWHWLWAECQWGAWPSLEWGFMIWEAPWQSRRKKIVDLGPAASPLLFCLGLCSWSGMSCECHECLFSCTV